MKTPDSLQKKTFLQFGQTGSVYHKPSYSYTSVLLYSCTPVLLYSHTPLPHSDFKLFVGFANAARMA